MDRRFGFESLLRDIQGLKLNVARRRGSAARQVTARVWSLSRRRCVVADYLNKFQVCFPNGSRRLIQSIVIVRNMKFVPHGV